MDHSFGRAKQKFFEALYALSGASTIDIGLTNAANYLCQLQPEDLPAGMREKAREPKQTIVEMDAKLGGLW